MKIIAILAFLLSFVAVSLVSMKVKTQTKFPCLPADAANCVSRCGGRGYNYCSANWIAVVYCHCKNGEVLVK